MKNTSRTSAKIIYYGGSLFLAAMVGFFLYVKNKPQPEQNGCLPTGYTDSAVIVIDDTDPRPPLLVENFIETTLQTLKDDVKFKPNVTMISVFRVNDRTSKNFMPIFAKCKPKQDGNELYENSKKIKKRALVGWGAVVEGITPGNTPSPESAVAEALTQLSLTQYLKPKGNSYLFLLSDMMQHSANLSLYGCRDVHTAIQTYTSNTVGGTPRPSFEGAQISIFLMPALDVKDSKVISCRNQFWTWFFRDAYSVEFH